MAIGEKLAAARRQKNYTQEQLAERLQVTRQTVSRWAVSYTHLTLPTIA